MGKEHRTCPTMVGDLTFRAEKAKSWVFLSKTGICILNSRQVHTFFKFHIS